MAAHPAGAGARVAPGKARSGSVVWAPGGAPGQARVLAAAGCCGRAAWQAWLRAAAGCWGEAPGQRRERCRVRAL